MRKQEHKKEPYISVNPTEQIPAVEEVDESTGKVVFTMRESHAILRYLCDSRFLPEHWYPHDLRKRALVDMYLDQHHSYLRQGVAGQVLKKVFAKAVLGKTYEDKDLDFHRIMFKRSMRLLEARLSKTRYLCSDEKSIADISAACELDQLCFIGGSIDAWPKTKAWLHNMIDEDPHMNAISAPIRKLAAMAVKKQQKEDAAKRPKL